MQGCMTTYAEWIHKTWNVQTYYVEDSLARISASAEKEQEYMGKNQVFGAICSHLLADFDLTSSSLRTSQQSLFEEAKRFSNRLPNWGIIVNGELYEAVQPSVLPTEEHAGFVLPTPTQDQREQRYAQGGRSTLCAILEMHKAMLPTPIANDAKNNPSTPSQWKRNDSLNVEAAKLTGKTKQTIGKKSRLHPPFVEWMMGFPIGWTE